ncbi:cytochrome c oxidase subunit II [Nocardioides mangrovicus]|uniref:Cytochrome c oxidase subunit 2 n=2 Tax=Nocardioides mangrovicus TaxID=2478913 RepID=A0A3L8P1Z3_9ACTN|nr:cytochrome c oxidase subunit II [Nocardioides mangrovicus]
MLALSGCADGTRFERVGMPAPKTKQAHYMLDLWQWAWLAAIIVGVVVWGLIFYAVIRFRRRSDDEIPVQTRYNLPIEIFYTIAPVVMVVVLFTFTVRVQDKVLPNDQNAPRPDAKILVVGQKWSWTFNYVDAADGKTVHEGGTPAQPPTLYLPINKNIRFDLYSPDVIHSFWVPAFLFKMDVVPGRDNHFTLTPDRTGTFDGKCAELCGTYHSRMLFQVKVVSESDYEAHIEKLAANPDNQGEAKGTNYDNVQPGLSQEKGSEE